MGQSLSQKQSATEIIVQFENVIDEVNSVKASPKLLESYGEALYKEYQSQCLRKWNPVRFYNHFRLFYAIRRMEYSVEQMKQMQQQMAQFDQLSYAYFRTYQQATKNRLFSTAVDNNTPLDEQTPKQSKVVSE